MELMQRLELALRAAVREALWQREQRARQALLDPLQDWVRALLSRPVPPDWPQRLDAFLDSFDGGDFRLADESRVTLRRWIARWAEYRRPALTSAARAPAVVAANTARAQVSAGGGYTEPLGGGAPGSTDQQPAPYDSPDGRSIYQVPIGFGGRDGSPFRLVGKAQTNATDQPEIHKDFNAGYNIPQVDPSARLHTTWDTGISFLHVSMYNFYTRSLRLETDVMLLEGAALQEAQVQSQQIAALSSVRRKLETDARTVLASLRRGDSGSFEDAGHKPITADFRSWSLRLTLGRYSVYWKAVGSVGRGKSIATNGQFRIEAEYSATVYWTLYDEYDFDTAGGPLFPPSWLGTEFKIFGFWEDDASGTVTLP